MSTRTESLMDFYYEAWGDPSNPEAVDLSHRPVLANLVDAIIGLLRQLRGESAPFGSARHGHSRTVLKQDFTAKLPGRK